MKDSAVHVKPPKKDDISFDYWLKYILCSFNSLKGYWICINYGNSSWCNWCTVVASVSLLREPALGFLLRHLFPEQGFEDIPFSGSIMFTSGFHNHPTDVSTAAIWEGKEPVRLAVGGTLSRPEGCMLLPPSSPGSTQTLLTRGDWGLSSHGTLERKTNQFGGDQQVYA